MLTHAPVTTIFTSQRSRRARQFYEGRLGLKPIGLQADGKFSYNCGGSTLALFPKEGGTKAEHTALSFRVPHIAASIAALKTAGVVVFEDYDFRPEKTIEHVCVLGAERRRGSTTPRATSCACTGLPGLRRAAASPSASRTRRPCRCSRASAA